MNHVENLNENINENLNENLNENHFAKRQRAALPHNIYGKRPNCGVLQTNNKRIKIDQTSQEEYIDQLRNEICHLKQFQTQCCKVLDQMNKRMVQMEQTVEVQNTRVVEPWVCQWVK